MSVIFFRHNLTVLTITFLLIFTCAGVSPQVFAASSDAGKKVGFAGDPAKKRGIEYGFDKGYMAGKKDHDADLKPDPKRHDDYTNSDKFYRYEFGSRAAFNSGFRSGFNGGYQKAYGKKVKMIDVGSSSPTVKSPSEEVSSKTPAKAPSAVNDAM